VSSHVRLDLPLVKRQPPRLAWIFCIGAATDGASCSMSMEKCRDFQMSIGSAGPEKARDSFLQSDDSLGSYERGKRGRWAS
jgi:hypothetical protein